MPPFFWLMVGPVIGSLLGPMVAFFTEMFTTDVRYSGASAGYQLGAVVGGGFAPLIATWLLQTTGTIAAVACYVAAAALITAIWVMTAEEHYDRPGPPGAARTPRPGGRAETGNSRPHGGVRAAALG